MEPSVELHVVTEFPVNFPVSREGGPETGSTMTGSSASQCCGNDKARDDCETARHLPVI